MFTITDNFKSLDSKSEKAEDDEFEQQRKAIIAEAMKAKEDGVSKKFGGGQKHVSGSGMKYRISYSLLCSPEFNPVPA